MDDKLLDKETKRTKIMAELAVGVEAKHLAEKYDESYAKIAGWKANMREGKLKKKVLDVAKEDTHLIELVVDEIKEKASHKLAPREMKKLEVQLDDLAESDTSLQIMDRKFHDTIVNMLGKVDDYLTQEIKVSEFTSLMKHVGELHKNIFSVENGTTVNLTQNNANVGGFKDGFRS